MEVRLKADGALRSAQHAVYGQHGTLNEIGREEAASKHPDVSSHFDAGCEPTDGGKCDTSLTNCQLDGCYATTFESTSKGHQGGLDVI